MNYRLVNNVLGKFILFFSLLLCFPLIIAFIYSENINNIMSFVIVIISCLIVGFLLTRIKVKRKEVTNMDGLIICGLSWLIFSAFGALPFVISGQIPRYIDAYFETMSGFTTTGSSILTDVEALSNSMLFWRSFTHLIGGMGVLVFALAFLNTKENGVVNIMKAEVPGPIFGKLVSRVKLTARLLYIIYIGMTILFIILLSLGKMNLFEATLHAFGAAGTGGFGIKNNSIAYYDDLYSEVVLGIAMLLFGINFNLYYYLLIKKFKDAFKDEELFTYLAVVGGAILLIVINTTSLYGSITTALRNAFFTVSSIVTTTGYVTADYAKWPLFSQFILFMLMFMGGCAGSTGGGLKVSRVMILFKNAIQEVKKSISPNAIYNIHINSKPLDKITNHSILRYFVLYLFILFFLVLLITIDTNDFATAFSSIVATFNNIGPGLNLVGPTANFAWMSDFSKIVLIISMFMGRLELLPVLALLSKKAYKRF